MGKTVDRCALRKMDKIEKIESDVNELQTKVAVLEEKFSHTIANKHAEAIAVAKQIELNFQSSAHSINLKVKYVSIILGLIGMTGMFISLYLTFGLEK